MSYETQNSASALLEKALKHCPSNSTGRMAVIAVGKALIDVSQEIASMRITIRAGFTELRSLINDPVLGARKSNMGRTVEALASDMPAGLKVEQCRSCDAPILWCDTRSGKRMPVDAIPDSEGTLGISTIGVVGEGFTGHLYTSHFSTCPDAPAHKNSSSRK